MKAEQIRRASHLNAVEMRFQPRINCSKKLYRVIADTKPEHTG